jgi:hypothetical protein
MDSERYTLMYEQAVAQYRAARRRDIIGRQKELLQSMAFLIWRVHMLEDRLSKSELLARQLAQQADSILDQSDDYARTNREALRAFKMLALKVKHLSKGDGE